MNKEDVLSCGLSRFISNYINGHYIKTSDEECITFDNGVIINLFTGVNIELKPFAAKAIIVRSVTVNIDGITKELYIPEYDVKTGVVTLASIMVVLDEYPETWPTIYGSDYKVRSLYFKQYSSVQLMNNDPEVYEEVMLTIRNYKQKKESGNINVTN